jgi:hypothetical protein
VKWKNLEYCFLNKQICKKVQTALEQAKAHPLGVDAKEGIHVRVVFWMDRATQQPKFLQLTEPVIRDGDGSSRLMVCALSSPPLTEDEVVDISGDIAMRIDIPLYLAYDKQPIQKYAIYHIRFKISDKDERFTDETSEPLRRGYIGITKRGFMTRFAEHGDKARNNTGFLFHSVWHFLLQEKIKMHPVIQLCGSAETLKEVYEMEEDAVQRFTLTPLGLNAIAGGMAGIRMMHKLRLLHSLKVGVGERDAALEVLQRGDFAHGSPCAHYRKGHMRKLAENRLTYVKPCWVNLKEVETA